MIGKDTGTLADLRRSNSPASPNRERRALTQTRCEQFPHVRGVGPVLHGARSLGSSDARPGRVHHRTHGRRSISSESKDSGRRNARPLGHSRRSPHCGADVADRLSTRDGLVIIGLETTAIPATSRNWRRAVVTTTAEVRVSVMGLSDLIEDYLLLWILFALGIGILVPSLSVVTGASTLVLMVMIGSSSLTLSVDQIRRIDRRTIGFILAGHVAMPFLA